MTEVAGEVCDGFLCHGFTTERYLREVTLPALERGLAKAGRTLEGFEIIGPAFVVTGATPRRRSRRASSTCKQQIAFYGSTPAYRPVLELHGWGDLQDELNALSKQGEWVEMGDAHRRRDPQHVRRRRRARGGAAELRKRYGDICTRITLTLPEERDHARWQGLFDSLRAA